MKRKTDGNTKKEKKVTRLKQLALIGAKKRIEELEAELIELKIFVEGAS